MGIDNSYIKILQTGSLHVESVPAGAKIYINNIYQGVTTPAVITDLLPGSYNLRLTITNTYTYEWTGIVYITSRWTTYLNATIIPIGNLNIISAPPGARIYIDDVEQTGITTPAIIKDLSSGTHTYRLSLSRYEDATGTFEIISGQTTILDIVLTPLSTLFTGYLYMTSMPLGARLYIDDIDTTYFTPMLMAIPLGIHTYRLTLSNYQDATGMLEIFSDQITPISINLTGITPPTPDTGSVSFISNPAGAKIYIDDIEQIGVITPTIISNIPVGSHTYKLTLFNHQDAIGTFDIILGQTTVIEATLEPLPSNTGGLNILSIPPGASIFIDNIDTGFITPSTIYNLTPGLHTYELELEGYATYRGTVEIFPNQVTEIPEITLIRYTGSISFISIPERASIFIDNIDTGLTTPSTITGISVGEHTYTLKLDNYNDYTGMIYVPRDTVVSINTTLILKEGCILFESLPSGADLIIEGMGRSLTTPIMLCDLPLGKLEYQLRYSGYKPFEGCTTLLPGQGDTIYIVLERR